MQSDEKTVVYNKDLKPLLSFDGGSVMFDGTIRVTTNDHIVLRYDYEGNLIHDFCISAVKLLEYESDKEDSEKKPIARLRSYTAGDGYEGLMTADGNIVTMPKYRDIEAIGPDLYLCEISIVDRVVVNGKGEEVR